MSHTPHDLAEMFPDATARIHDLKSSDTRFAGRLAEHDAVNREILRAETGVTPMDDARLTALRRQRLHLLDEIARRLAQD